MARKSELEIAQNMKKIAESQGLPTTVYQATIDKYAPKATTPAVSTPKATTTPTSGLDTITSHAINAASKTAANMMPKSLANKLNITGDTFAKAATEKVNTARQAQAMQAPIPEPVATPDPVQEYMPMGQDIGAILQELKTIIQQQNQKAMPTYESSYNDQINQLLSKYNSRPEFSFDATNNPTIQAYLKQAADAAYQDAARRNFLYSDVAKAKAAEKQGEVMATVAPQLEQQAFNQYQQQGNNILDQINMLTGIDQTGYGRHMDSVNYDQNQQNNAINNIRGLLSTVSDIDNTAYNRQQSADQTAYNRQRDDIADQRYADQAEYSKERDSIADQRYADETEYNRAMTEFQIQMDLAAQEYAANPNNPENLLKIAKLQQAQAELDNYMRYGGQIEQAKLNDIMASIGQKNASATSSYASAGASNARRDQILNDINNPKSSSKDSFGLTYKQYYDDSKRMLDEGGYEKYQIYQWLLNSSLSSPEVEQLIKDLNFKEKDLTPPPNTAGQIFRKVGD